MLSEEKQKHLQTYHTKNATGKAFIVTTKTPQSFVLILHQNTKNKNNAEKNYVETAEKRISCDVDVAKKMSTF